MHAELPMACSLNGAELPRRLEGIRAVGESLVQAESDGRHALLRFRPEARARLEAVVAAEAECCAFLAMELADEPGAVRLEIDAPSGAEPVVAELVRAFAG